jgi:4-hydroxy-tetrahydrodipicolinate reductase
MIKVAVPGAAGRMGRAIIKVLAETDEAELAAAIERPGHADLGKDAGTLAGLAPAGVQLTHQLDQALEVADVIIDFTAPAATAWTVSRAADAEVGLVIGTTGLGEAERRAVERAAEKVPVVWSPNMSVGVNLVFGLLETAARALGDGYDVEIVELHHRQKRDAPSGTAVRMAEVLAEALGRDLGQVGVYGRRGDVGARTPEPIGVHAVRGGDVVGDHTVHFLGLGERVEITHRASSRDTFARGAVRAALWLGDRDPGLYDMQDVLGLRR